MGDDIGYGTYFTINSYGQPTVEYRPIRPIGNNLLYGSPIQQYYNELCNTEITAEQCEEIKKILKRQKREEEKRKAIKEFYELTRVLENRI